jgi:hypothetical protein
VVTSQEASAVSVVVVVVWVPDTALVTITEVVAAGVVGGGGCDVATAMGRSGRGGRGWGLGWGAVVRLGSVCRRLRGVGGRSGAGEGIVAGVATIVNCDMAVVTGCKGRGWGGGWGAVGRFGSVCRRLRGAAGRFDSGGEAVVAVANGIGNRDVAVTGCVGVVGRDVAGAGDGGGMKTVQQGVVWDRVRGSVDIPASLSGRGGSF